MHGETDLGQRIHERLGTLEPALIELFNESGRHIGHEGAKGGGSHFRLNIVSQHFSGKSLIERHHMIYAALGDLMHREIHALAIHARAPGEDGL